MKRLKVVAMVLGFLMISTSFVFAEWFAKEKEKPAIAAVSAPAPAPVAQKVVPQKQMDKAQEAITKKKVEINQTQWSIETKLMSGKGKAEKDILNFSDNKVSSKNMEAKGYAPTNYSVRILEDNETYTWETMQISEKEGVAFWRGDIGSDEVMRGVVSIRDKKNNVTDYNFHSVEKTKLAPVVPPPAA